MTGLSVENTESKLIFSIDKSNFSESVLLKVMEIARLEYLIAKAAFDESILEVDAEMKANWWKENEGQILANR